MSIIVPAYNEERAIGNALRELSRHFRGAEVIVVADGNDRTAEVARDADVRGITVKVVSFGKRMGKWGSIRRGIEEARGETISFIDADLSVSAGEARRLAGLFRELPCDMIVASRYAEGSKIRKRQPIQRVFASRAFNLATRMLFRMGIGDTQCGFKVFRGSLGKEVAGAMECSGFEGDVEFIWIARKLGASVREEPVEWKDDDRTSLRPYHMLLMLLGLVRLRIRWLRGEPA